MDRGARFRTPDRRAAGPINPSRTHSGNEWGELSVEEQQEKTRSRPTIACHPAGTPPDFGGGFRSALNAPPYGRRRAPLQPPQKTKKQRPKDKEEVIPFSSVAVGTFHSALDTWQSAIAKHCCEAQLIECVRPVRGRWRPR